MLEEWLTATEAAKYLDVSRTTINNLTKQLDPATGKPYGTRRGTVWLFTKAELNRWMVTPRHGGGRPKSSAGTLPTVRPA